MRFPVVILSLVLLVTQGTTTPLAGSLGEHKLIARDDELIPRSSCPAVQQTNLCSVGTAFCCNTEGDGEFVIHCAYRLIFTLETSDLLVAQDTHAKRLPHPVTKQSFAATMPTG